MNPTTFTHFPELVRQYQPDAMCVQELMRTHDMVDDATRVANSSGHHAVFGPSLRTTVGGCSAGVAVTSTWRWGFSRLVDDIPPSVVIPCPSRFVCAKWHAVAKQGILMCSLYLWTGEGLSMRNRCLLDCVGSYLFALSMPFVIGADWQVPPDDLCSSGFPMAVNAQVVAPEGYTYKVNEYTATLDYFLVSDVLYNADAVVSCNVLDQAGIVSKHFPVELVLSGECTRSTCKTIRKPKALPVHRAIGCPRHFDNSKVKDLANNIVDKESLNAAYVAFAHAAEEQVLDAVGLCPDDAGQRAVPPRVAEVPTLGMCNGRPHSDCDSRMWRALQKKLDNWEHLYLRGKYGQAVRVLLACLRFVPVGAKPEQWDEWRWYISALKATIGSSSFSVQWFTWALQTKEWVTALAAGIEAQHAASRYESWQQWCRKAAAEAGAPKVHAFARGRALWAHFLVDGATGQTSPQVDADLRAEPWHDIWTHAMEGGTLEWPHFSEEDLAMITLPTYVQFMLLCRTFKITTGIGCCGFHPRHYGLITEELYASLLLIWLAMLRMGAAPEIIELLIVLLLPKATGGDRPIGLFPTCIRVLNRWLRTTYGEMWRAANDRDYFYGSKGKGALVCNWRVAAFAEYAKAVGKHAIAAFLDIVKAFEYIEHFKLKQNAVRYGFSLVVLKYLVAIYTMPRRIRVGQVITAEVVAKRSVVPGDSFADLLMRLAVMPVLDDVAHAWPVPRLHIGVVVDDIQLLAIGDVVTIASDVAGAVDMIVDGLDRDGLVVSDKPGKFTIIASTAAAAEMARNKVRIRKTRCNKAVQRSVRNIGVDLSLVARATKVQQGRLKKASYRAARYARVGKAGVPSAKMAHIAKACISSVGLYGAGVTGLSDTAIDQVRAAVHKAVVPKPHGRSVTADLELCGKNIDPAYDAAIMPLTFWACALWLGWMPKVFMIRTFMQAVTTIGRAKNPWQLANGPASVVVACLLRIGWKPTAPFRWETRNGSMVDLEVVCAADLARLAALDVRWWLWNRASDHRPGYADFSNQPPYLQPVRHLAMCKASDNWTHGHMGMLRAVVAEAAWGLEHCHLCGEKWSVWHDAWSCPAMKAFRDQYDLPSTVRACAARGRNVPMFTNTLVPEPFTASPRPLVDSHIEWAIPDGAIANFGAEAFGDGSGLYATHDVARRCGWAVVAIERRGSSTFLGAAAFDLLQGPVQEVPMAELQALVFFVQHSMPGPDGYLDYYSDCQWVIDTYTLGRHQATQPMAVFAGLWKRLFRAVDDVLANPGMLRLTKVRAHASLASCGQDEMLLLYKRGNDEADRLAKLGAARHTVDQQDVLRLKRIGTVQPIVAKYLARLGVAKLEKYGKAAVPPVPPIVNRRILSKTPADAVVRAVSATDHRICRDHASLRVRCALCLASAECIDTLCKVPCKAAESCRAHNVWAAGSFIFCSRCGAYSELRTGNLGKVCLGFPGSDAANDRRKKLLNGYHPIQGSFMAIPKPGILLDMWHEECPINYDESKGQSEGGIDVSLAMPPVFHVLEPACTASWPVHGAQPEP